MTPRYIRWQAALGRGDLHPGGREASALLARWVEPWRGGLLVEVGAGAGLSAARYAADGWSVVATEPDAELAEVCRSRGVTTHRSSAANLPNVVGGGEARVVLAESVLFALDLPRVLPRIAETLATGGALAFSEMIWTERADAATVRHVHDASLAAFGIAVASRERWTWADWRGMLDHAGFTVEKTQALADGSGLTRSLSRAAEWREALRHPTAALGLWRARRAGVPRVPADWFESVCVLAVRR